MKKLTALLLSVVLVLSLAACGSVNKPASSTTQPETSAPTEQPATEPSESSSTAPAESGDPARDRQDTGGLLLRFR